MVIFDPINQEIPINGFSWECSTIGVNWLLTTRFQDRK
jgi:hypothetical protein